VIFENQPAHFNQQQVTFVVSRLNLTVRAIYDYFILVTGKVLNLATRVKTWQNFLWKAVALNDELVWL